MDHASYSKFKALNYDSLQLTQEISSDLCSNSYFKNRFELTLTDFSAVHSPEEGEDSGSQHSSCERRTEMSEDDVDTATIATDHLLTICKTKARLTTF